MTVPIPSPANAQISGLGRIEGFPWNEFIPAAKFIGVGAAWTTLDYFGHQLLEPLRGEKTPPGYFGSNMIFSTSSLIVGRLFSDLVGGSQFTRAIVLGTTANAVMQLRYLFSMPASFNIAGFLLHQVILIPLSFLITGKSRDPYPVKEDTLIVRET